MQLMAEDDCRMARLKGGEEAPSAVSIATAVGVDVHEQVGFVAAGCRDVAQAGILARLDDGHHRAKTIDDVESFDQQAVSSRLSRIVDDFFQHHAGQPGLLESDARCDRG